MQYVGIEYCQEDKTSDGMEKLVAEIEIEIRKRSDNEFTEYGNIDEPTVIKIPDDHAILHTVTGRNPFNPSSY